MSVFAVSRAELKSAMLCPRLPSFSLNALSASVRSPSRYACTSALAFRRFSIAVLINVILSELPLIRSVKFSFAFARSVFTASIDSLRLFSVSVKSFLSAVSRAERSSGVAYLPSSEARILFTLVNSLPRSVSLPVRVSSALSSDFLAASRALSSLSAWSLRSTIRVCKVPFGSAFQIA